ncbi:MAG TPA: HEAT repeat domain-containing protein [Pirellulaceae bacterium]|jgi:putative heme-binding domain-containing protein|nr:HEAT repeat domain-containing protein [Pirellulaceae bacterium]
MDGTIRMSATGDRTTLLTDTRGCSPSLSRTSRRLFALSALLAVALTVGAAPALAQQPNWIWSPDHTGGSVPSGSCYFRQTFRVTQPEGGTLLIVADDEFVVYLNGKKVGENATPLQTTRYDLRPYLQRGNNLIAIETRNSVGNSAGLAAQVYFKEQGGQWSTFVTDADWKTALKPLPFWENPAYNDSFWKSAQVFGPLVIQQSDDAEADPAAEMDITKPPVPPDALASKTKLAPVVDADKVPPVPPTTGSKPAATAAASKLPAATVVQRSSSRWKISPEFAVEEVLHGDKTGSLICIAVNEFGTVLASQEGGPLLAIQDSDGDGKVEEVTTYCDLVKNVQGILPLNGDVYVTADGPDGAALYRLTDGDRDGTLEGAEALLQFEGSMGEHGPHAIALGPDGFLYTIVGNHTVPKFDYVEKSPYRHPYEGDAIEPKYEDPGGHAVGIKAPGGAVIRTDLDGREPELIAGGIRNAYDLAFNMRGDLFTYDSDMESDVGSLWYRPTRLLQVQPGGEFGWRSGWSKWPDHFVDVLPPTLTTGRGSPTGVCTYEHFAFPERYHHAMFLADWSEGRILAVGLKPDGAGYRAQSETFLEGEPLNVTDLCVSPEGGIYFCCGGRDTGGGLYHIKWKGQIPPSISNLGTGLTAVVRQPQIDSAVSRQKIAALRLELGDEWSKSLEGVARSRSNPSSYRLRALDLLQLFGPKPRTDFLVQLSEDASEEVRAKAAELLGLAEGDEAFEALVGLLKDSDRGVRRRACEALVRAGRQPSFDALQKSLASDDRFESWAARRLLETMPPVTWREQALNSDDIRVFLQGATALMISSPEPDYAKEILAGCEERMEGFVSDRDFVDMLRTIELCLIRGGLRSDDLPTLRDKIAGEFPAGDPLMNRELIRILARLQVDDVKERYLAYLKSEAAVADRLHMAFHLRFLKIDWSDEEIEKIVRFFEEAKQVDGGPSYEYYISNVTRDMVRELDPAQGAKLLAAGERYPDAALGALYLLPEELDEATTEVLFQLDDAIAEKEGEDFKRLRAGVVAALSLTNSPKAPARLRKIWDTDPDRRMAVALCLASTPQGENWSYLLRSLSHLDGDAAVVVLEALKSVPQKPADAEFYRQALLCGLRSPTEAGPAALALLEFWNQTAVSDNSTTDERLADAQVWFAGTFPDSPAAELPRTVTESKWQFDELLKYLDGEEGEKASAARGAEVFVRAQCANCHKHGRDGKGIGPDLSSVAKRFTQKEIVEATLYPSHVVSDQYRAWTIVTTGGKSIVGIASRNPQGDWVVTKSDSEQVTVKVDDVVSMEKSNVSHMPEGLLNDLTLEEIADLFEFLKDDSRTGVAVGSPIAPPKR